MLTQPIIRLAFFLQGSERYRKIKQFFRDLLNNPDFKYKKYFDTLMIFLILTSVGILVYEVRNPVPEWLISYDVYVVSLIFAIEYLMRLWVYSDVHTEVIRAYEEAKFLHKPFKMGKILLKVVKQKLRYMFSLPAIIDFLAILPAYRPLRILRIFVLFRVFKLLRYTKSINQFVDVLSNKRFELFTLLFLLLFIVITAGIAIYVFEEDKNPSITTLFDAFYWALVTISTVGYGDISPVTPQGRAISILIIISGIAMISFVTSVIVSAFSEKLDELKENRIIEELNRTREFLIVCGYGQMTKMFLRQEKGLDKQHYVIIDKNADAVEQAIKDGYQAINEDPSRHDVLVKFNYEYARITVLCLTDSDVENIYIALNAKSLSPEIKVIARATDEGMKKKYELAGVDHVLLPGRVTSMMLLTAITKPVLFRGIYAILTGQHVAHIDEVYAHRCYQLIDKKIEEIDFKRYRLLLIGIQRGKEGKFLFNPPANTTITEEDILVLMGLEMSINYFRESYGGSAS
ncbi:MAG: potassium channel protein [Sulfurovum sp.]|nr:MAG: potassium channel protein [Sulfurovum sp.]